MKVLHVIWDLGQGGAQRYLLNLLEAHYTQISCSVLVLSSPGSLSAEIETVCDEVHYLGMTSGKDYFSFVRMIRFLRSKNYDLIHSHSNNILFNIALHFQSLPVLYTEHGGRLLGNVRQAAWIYKWLNRPIKRFLAISYHMRQVMLNTNPAIKERIVVIYNGVDVDAIRSVAAQKTGWKKSLNNESSSQVVGFVGRFVHQKGVDLFIKTAVYISSETQNDNVVFVMAGDGPLFEDAKSQAKSLGLGGKIIFLGYCKDMFPILKNYDIMLFTSRFEPFGLVITEAMAAGVSIVAMDQEGAVSEIIRDGVDGYVIKGTDLKCAADRVLQLLRDDETRQRMAVNAATRVREKFSMKNNADCVWAEYKTVLNQCSQGRA